MGDHIEKLNGEEMVGKRHFEVAKLLKEIPKGSTFTIRLVEPMKSGFTSIAPKTGKTGKKSGYGTGKETLRFKAGGQAEIGQQVGRVQFFRIRNGSQFSVTIKTLPSFGILIGKSRLSSPHIVNFCMLIQLINPSCIVFLSLM